MKQKRNINQPGVQRPSLETYFLSLLTPYYSGRNIEGEEQENLVGRTSSRVSL